MKKVDSRRNAIFVIASGACTAWQSISTPKVDSSMDRHADKSARDDKKEKRKKSRFLTTHASGKVENEQSNNSTQETRRQDFEARIVALQSERGDKPRWLSHKRAAAIHDSSPKANAKRSKL